MDKERILSLLSNLDVYLKEFERYLPQNFKEYDNNIEKQRFCERTLQLSIEICIDVSNIILKELKLGLPSGEENVFEKLCKEKIISTKITNKLKDMKKFRNVLIHRYTDVINKLVYDHATKEKDDFLSFKKEILKFIKNK